MANCHVTRYANFPSYSIERSYRPLCSSTAGEAPRAAGEAIMPELSWARVKTDLHLGLRRGAWYRGIRETGSQVILDVDHQPATGLRADLASVSARPDGWTIVERPSE